MGDLVDVRGVSKRFSVAGGRELWAVRGVDLTIGVGETVGLVGESGSGKTTLGRLITRLEVPTEGTVTIEGADPARSGRSERRQARGRLQMVFQNPRDALNPRLRIAASISEPLRVHEPRIDSGVVRRKIEEAAELVLFPRGHLDRLPQELSAGEQQRAALARAIITRPALIVLDEPTSMLDASLRAGMVRTFADLQNALGVAFLLISHDFLTVAGLSHRIGVMYLGGIVELGATRDVLRNPIHPYSRALLGAIPVIAASQPPRAVVLQGEIPSPIDRPSGCPLVQRCPFAESRCGEQNPPLYELETGHTAACFVAADRLPKGEWEPVLTPGQVLAARIRTLATPQESTAPAASAIVAETVQTVEQPLLWER